MNVKVGSYLHASNGINIEVVPETDAEQDLLDAIWKHGYIDSGYSDENPRAKCYLIRAFDAQVVAGGE